RRAGAAIRRLEAPRREGRVGIEETGRAVGRAQAREVRGHVAAKHGLVARGRRLFDPDDLSRTLLDEAPERLAAARPPFDALRMQAGVVLDGDGIRDEKESHEPLLSSEGLEWEYGRASGPAGREPGLWTWLAIPLAAGMIARPRARAGARLGASTLGVPAVRSKAPRPSRAFAAAGRLPLFSR